MYPMAFNDVVVVKGAQTKVIDDFVVFGDKTLDGITATMTVNFPGINSVHTYVKTTMVEALMNAPTKMTQHCCQCSKPPTK